MICVLFALWFKYVLSKCISITLLSKYSFNLRELCVLNVRELRVLN